MIIAIYRNGGDDDDVRDMTDRLDLDAGNVTLTENAEELTVGSSTMILDDPLGDWNIAGHAYVRVTETEADDTIIWAGFATIREISRGEYGPTEAARQWALTLDDVNTVIARRILTDSEWNRPAETDVERIQALFDANFLGPDDSFFSTDNPVDLDAADCRGMTVYDVVNDCMQQSGKNSYQQDIEDGTPPDPYGSDGYVGTTWYDFAASEARSSDLQISNYLDDITAQVGDFSPPGPAQTWEASLDTKCRRDPTRIYWKIVGNYDGGQVVRMRLPTAAQFAARETTASWPLVKTAAQAAARADRMLLDISTEEDVITTTILVHPDHINDARAGHRIQARFSHLPGYEDWTWMRILNRTAKLVTPRVWAITYTLSPNSLVNPSGTCTTVLATAETYDSGQQGSAFPPVSVAPSNPSDYPAVVIGALVVANDGTAVGGLVSITGGTPFTIIDMHDPTTNYEHTIAVTAYEAVAAGSPGLLSISWTGSAEAYRGLAIALQTAATAPVQHAMSSSGGTTTLPGAPTVGNLLIAIRVVETSPFSSGPVGFTQLATGTITTGAPGFRTVDIWGKCVAEGDTAAINTWDTSFTHWAFVSEWAIT
jgi:hypothetical protein